MLLSDWPKVPPFYFLFHFKTRVTNFPTDEASIIQGAIDLHSKTAASVLTPYENVSKLDFNQILNAETCQKVAFIFPWSHFYTQF